jgi:predicted nucleotidyltransferase
MIDFPTPDHARVADLVVEYAARLGGVDSVLVVNSCARGQAVAESDLDMAILMSTPVDADALEAEWHTHLSTDATLTDFRDRSAFSAVHLDFFDGTFESSIWDDGGGPDDFEIEIGNRVAYAEPLGAPGPAYDKLNATWLPYYDPVRRDARLRMAIDGCLLDLEFVPFYVRRTLHLQAFDRLYKAFRQ